MKPVSMEALKRRALAMGGKLEVNGSAFNAARVQGSAIPAKKPDTATAPALPPPPSKDERTLTAIEQMSQIQSQVLQVMQTNMQAKPAAREWDFTINRDAKGNLMSIKAISKE